MLSILLIVYNSFQRFYNLRFSANLSLKKPTILAPQTRLNDFSSNSLVPTERERVGRVGENPGNEVVHPNPWKFWNFLTCHYIFPLRIAGLIFFCLWAHTRICTETTWQWLRVARVVFPVRVLFIFGSRYMPEIYRIFTLLYALIVPAKIIFFQHRCDCVYGKSSGCLLYTSPSPRD